MPLKSAQLRKAYLHFLKVTGPCITNFRGKNEIQQKKNEASGKPWAANYPGFPVPKQNGFPSKFRSSNRKKKKKRKGNARQKFPAFFESDTREIARCRHSLSNLCRHMLWLPVSPTPTSVLQLPSKSLKRTKGGKCISCLFLQFRFEN